MSDMKRENMEDLNEDLLGRMISGTMSSSDEQELLRWENLCEDNHRQLEGIRSVMDCCERLDLMESIDTVGALNKIKGETRRSSVFAKTVSLWSRVAAVIAIPLMLLSTYLVIRDKDTDAGMIQVSTPFGLVSEVVLPDSTVVRLNSDSRLKYPTRFASAERVVELEGEAFFSVRSDEEHPFVVHCKDIDVQAVGTKFNILTTKSGDIITSLVEGKVNILKPSDDERIFLTSLLPGQTARYYKSDDILTKAGHDYTKKYTAWLDGNMVFTKDPLKDVVEELNRYYNIQVTIDENIGDSYRYTGTFRKMDIDRLFKYIEYTTPVKITLEGEEPDGMKKYRISKK